MKRVGKLSFLFVFFGLSVVGCGPKEGTLEFWVNDLEARKVADRIKAVDEIAKMAEAGLDVSKTVQPLINFYKVNTDDKAKERAAVALGKIGDKSAVSALCDFLSESAKIDQPKVNNRSRALAYSLGEIGDSSANPTLVKVAETASDDSVKRTAITALGQLKAKEAVDLLIRILLDNGENLLTRQRAILALGDIGDPKAVDSLVFALFVEDRGISLNEYANRAIHRLGPAAVDKLIETLEGKNEKVNEYIKLHPDWPQGIGELKAMLTLGDLGDPRAVQPILKLMEKNDYQIPGAMALAFLQDKSAAPKLLEMLKMCRDDEKKVKIQFGSAQSVFDALVAIYDAEKTIPAMMDVAAWRMKKYPDYYDPVRFHLILALSKMVGKAEADKWLELIGKEQDKDAAKWYVAEGKPRVEAAKECDKDYACWVKKLDDKNCFVRERATLELGRSGDVKYLDPILTKSLSDSEVCSSGYKRCEACAAEATVAVREAAVDALLKLGPKASKKAVDAIAKQLEEDKNRSTYKKVKFRYEVVKNYLSHKK